MNSHERKTLYLDVSTTSQLVKKVGFRTIIRKLIDQLRTDFSRWEEFDKSPRTANHSNLGVIELMPVSDKEQYGFKYVNGHPKNPDVGLTTVMAFGALAEMSTGYPILISEMTLLTAIRTAATSVLAAMYLARSDSKSMAMIGNGAQSEFQILAFQEMLGISKFYLYDVDSKATDKLIGNLAGEKGLSLIKMNSIAEAVKDVDIITTCTADKKKATILTLDQVQNGVFINAIGGDCPGKTELQKEILDLAKVYVEYAPQTRIEGEIQQVDESFQVIELNEVIKGLKEGRVGRDEITIFDSVGFSLEDFSILKLIYELARENEVGLEMQLIPELDDVKDLFALIKGR